MGKLAKIEKDDRIRHIMERMREMRWLPGDEDEYAMECGVAPSTIRGDAVLAAQAIRLGNAPDIAGAKLNIMLEKQMADCVTDVDRKNLIRFMELFAKVNGALVNRSETNHTHEVKQFNPRDARAAFYQKNNRIGDMTDTLNVEVIEERELGPPDEPGDDEVPF